MIRRGKNLTLAEIQQIIENEWSASENEETEGSTYCHSPVHKALKNAEQMDVVVLPPELVHTLSDSEDIPDKIVGDIGQDPANQEISNMKEIAGGAELHLQFSDDDNSEDEIPLSLRQSAQPKWRNWPSASAYFHAPVDVSQENLRVLAEKYGHYSPIELFELFFDREMLDHIVECTNYYATADKSNTDFRTYTNEIKTFIGILFLTGYHTLPSIPCYWSEKPSLGCPVVKMNMPRDRFMRIKTYFHVCKNDELDVSDKFAKVAPFNEILNRKFMQFGMFEHHLSIDEQMIAYYGKHGCNVFIRGKPIRFGFKYWDLCSSDGYLFQFQPYGGANTNNQNGYGLGENVVMQLLQHCDNPKNHTVAFDNFFTSWKLMSRLNVEGFFVAGTVREGRTRKARLLESKQIMKRERGAINYSYDPNNNILAIRWHDNAPVTILTNYLYIKPYHSVKRYEKKANAMVAVKQPDAIFQYNKLMGGVNLFDNALNNYRIKVRGKKWYWPLITYGLDAALVNAWKLHCAIAKYKRSISGNEYRYRRNQSMSQLLFRIEVTEALLQINNVATVAQIRLRTDGVGHAVAKRDCRVRCRQCNFHTIYFCPKCNAALHPQCFMLYHNVNPQQ